LRNLVKTYWSEQKLPIGSYIRIGGSEFRYEATETEKLDNEAILAMYENEEITRENFLKMINIDKVAAANALGGDVIADLTETVIGKKVDIRVLSLPVEHEDDEYVAIIRKVRSRVKPRKKFGKDAPTKVSENTRAKPRRKIKVKSK
jgi:hypothetical protein